jgi:hypothetical protein
MGRHRPSKICLRYIALAQATAQRQMFAVEHSNLGSVLSGMPAQGAASGAGVSSYPQYEMIA